MAELLGNGLSVRDLECTRSGRRIFSGVNFDVAPGEAVQVRGANGSGKSSLLRLLCGLLQPSRGEVHWRGLHIAARDAGLAGDVAYMGHADGLSAELTVRENLLFCLRMAGRSGAEAEGAGVLNDLRLAHRVHEPVRQLSQGQRRRLNLARVVLSKRRLWLLDEPCAGLDTQGEQRFDAYLAEHLRQGGLAVVTTHRDIDRDGPCARALEMDSFNAVSLDSDHRS